MSRVDPSQDVIPDTPRTKEVEIPANATIVVVNHWDWPFAWIMCGVFIVASFLLWMAGKKKR